MDRLYPETYKQLCYRNFQSSDEPPPFNILVNPNSFLAAELPGIAQSETFFVEALHQNPIFTSIALDFIGYERKFKEEINSLLITLGSPGQMEQEPARSLLQPLQQIINAHSILLGNLEDITRKHESTFLRDFIVALTDSRVLFQAHSDYISQFITVENFAINLSLNPPTDFRSQFPNDLLVRYFKLPITWQKYACSAASDIIWSFPHDGDRRLVDALNDFRRQSADLARAIDSIPKLEQISKLFLREPIPIAVSGRRFVKEGRCLKQCRKGLSERVLLLFSDLLMYVQLKGGKYLVPGIYRLSFLRVVPAESTGHPSIEIYSPAKSFVVLFTDPGSRDGWHLALQDAILNARAQRKIANYREAPLWVPDSESNECMGCKAALGFFKRKHHCRACGWILCSNCLSKKFLLPQISASPSIVCQKCYDQLVREQARLSRVGEDELAELAVIKPAAVPGGPESDSSDEGES
jgi:hypothetical protein